MLFLLIFAVSSNERNTSLMSPKTYFTSFQLFNHFILSIMTDNLQKLLHCLDEYMLRTGKQEIDDMEANSELARAGLLEDEDPAPGRPLREILMRLRDSNLLPQNIRHLYGRWKIRISGTIAKAPMFFQFQCD